MTFADEVLAVADEATPLTRATYDGATAASIQVDSGRIRFSLSTTPVAGSVGTRAESGDTIVLTGRAEIEAFRAISDDVDVASLQVTYTAP